MPSPWRGPWAAPAFPRQAVEGRTRSPHLARYLWPSTGSKAWHTLWQQYLLLHGHMYFMLCTRSFWWAGWATCSLPGSNGSKWKAQTAHTIKATPAAQMNTCKTQSVCSSCVQRQAVVKRPGTP